MRSVCVVVGLQAVATAHAVWTQIANTGPVGRALHAITYDSQRGKAVLFGGAHYNSSNSRS